MKKSTWLHTKIGLALALLGTGCGDFMTVTNPGPIQDKALNSRDAIPGLVGGMSYNLSMALGGSGTTAIVLVTGLVSGEISHSGSYPLPPIFAQGLLNAEDVDGVWARAQRARWVAEDGIERARPILGETDYARDPYMARANLLAGVANRILGENMCHAVISVGAEPGGQQDRLEHFKRAESYFSEAIRIGQAAGKSDIVNGGYAGRATVRAWQGKWAEAVADAKQVPTNFSYIAAFSGAKSDNWNLIQYETYDRLEYSVAETEFASRLGDPRAPWDTARTKAGAVAKGPNGMLALQQRKYMERGAAIPVLKGTEMRLIEAESALRAGDIATAVARMDDARKFYNLPPLATPATLAEAWKVFQAERGATLWLEGRRLWDLARWDAESGPGHRDFPAGRARCVPISQEEKASNPKLRG
jgi:hypothetical protein